MPAPHNDYPLRNPKYHQIGETRPSIEVHYRVWIRIVLTTVGLASRSWLPGPRAFVLADAGCSVWFAGSRTGAVRLKRPFLDPMGMKRPSSPPWMRSLWISAAVWLSGTSLLDIHWGLGSAHEMASYMNIHIYVCTRIHICIHARI